MKTIILILSLILAISCNSDDDNSQFQSTEITFTEIGKGNLDGNGSENVSQSNLLINNQTDWQNLIDQMNSVNNISNSFTETTIDFDSYSIVAIFLDIKPTGWEVSITNITENETNISVSIQETEMDNTVITQPFHIVKIPKTNKEIMIE
tara:strand:- start:136 stop:585 length:450 start_codon:yes stop_codon:yes gene_type:complete